MSPENLLRVLDSRIGCKGTLIIDTGLYKGIYAPRLEDIRSEVLCVSHPMLRAALLPVMRNVELKLRLEVEGNIYQIPVAVVRNSLSETIPLLLLGISEMPRKFRDVVCSCPVDFAGFSVPSIRVF